MPEPQYDIILPPCRRGTEFKYHGALENAWTEASLTGGLLFTLRKSLPLSSVITDTVVAGGDVVHQSSLANGEIVFSTTTAYTITIPSSFTNTWPARRLFWDLQGKVTIGARVFDIAAGTIVIEPDITRTP